MHPLFGLVLAPSISLFRGADIGDPDFKYWAVEDTFLSPVAQTENYGRDFLLSGGPRQPILVRFSDLNRALGHNSVAGADLVLHQEIGGVPKLRAVYKVERRWGEGPGRRGDVNFMGGADNGRVNPPGSATFKDRFAGSLGWNVAGGVGTNEFTKIDGVTMDSTEGVLKIHGLGPAVQDQLQHPDRNFGFALEFEAPCDFDSSDAPSAEVRPRLDVQTASIAAPGYDGVVASLFSSGAQVTAVLYSAKGTVPKGAVRWYINDRLARETQHSDIAEGTSQQVTLDAKADGSDPAVKTVTCEMDGADDDASNNSMTLYAGGTALSIGGNSGDIPRIPGLIRFLNDVALPQSRFSFAMAGSPKRFNAVAGKSGGSLPSSLRETLKSLAPAMGMTLTLSTANRPDTGTPVGGSIPHPGITGIGDTSDESGLLKGLGRLYEPWSDPLLDAVDVYPTDLFSATEVAELNGLPTPPAQYYLRVTTQAAQVLAKTKCTVKTLEGKVLFEGETTEGGFLLVPSTALGSEPVVWLEVNQGNRKGGALVWQWHFIEAQARGGKRPVTAQYALQVTDIDLDEGTNLVRGKPVTTINNDPDGYRLTDGASDGSYTFQKSGDWAEIDLGRDRLFAAVEIQSTEAYPAGRLDVYVRETGEEQQERRLFARSLDLHWAGAALAKQGTLRLYGLPSQARYVRLVWRGKTALKLSEVGLLAGKKQ